MPIQKRNLAMYIVLSIVTCGLLAFIGLLL